MYHEEKMIGGKLMCRTTPDGKWEECSIEKAWDKITQLEDQVNELTACMRTVSNMTGQYAQRPS